MFRVGDEFRLQAKNALDPEWWVCYRILEVRPNGYWALPFTGSPALLANENRRTLPFVGIPRLLHPLVKEQWQITPINYEPYWEVVACHE